MLDQDFWKRYFRVYDTLSFIAPYKNLLDDVVTEVQASQGDRVLDAGAGTGNLAVLLKKKGCDVTAIDFSREALDVLREKTDGVEIIIHNLVEKLPFTDESFDHIVSNNVLYNLPRTQRGFVMKELFRVLKGGGRLVLVNAHQGFVPWKVYVAAISSSLKQKGFFSTAVLIFSLFVPTAKILWYNLIIKRRYAEQDNNLFMFGEQEELMRKAGFRNVSKEQLVYAGQCVLNKAEK